VLDRSEAERGKADANFQWLANSIAADEKLRERKSLSLNLAKRKAEREASEAARLKLENDRRAALGKPVYATTAELDAAASAEAVADKELDILLDSTTQIVGDIVAGVGGLKPPVSRPIAQQAPTALAR
jgi:multidrug resistance efflux pump